MPTENTSYGLVFAVFDKLLSGTFRHLGTAFTIGGGVFATAGHVAEMVDAAAQPFLVKRESNNTVSNIPISGADIFPVIDFGLLHADFDSIEMPWSGEFLSERRDVWTEGFGFGFDQSRRKVITRFLKGHIVSRQIYDNWAEIDPVREECADYKFGLYELSFMVPSGQSGSPLVWNSENGNSAVIGVVIGNSQASIGTLDKAETVSDGHTIERVEYHNFLSLGAAISTHSLLTLHSPTLGRTVIEHFSGKVANLA